MPAGNLLERRNFFRRGLHLGLSTEGRKNRWARGRQFAGRFRGGRPAKKKKRTRRDIIRIESAAASAAIKPLPVWLPANTSGFQELRAKHINK